MMTIYHAFVIGKHGTLTPRHAPVLDTSTFSV